MGREGGFHFTISWDEELDAEITSKGMDGTGEKKRKWQNLNLEHSTTYFDGSFQSEAQSVSILQENTPSYFKEKISYLCPTDNSY